MNFFTLAQRYPPPLVRLLARHKGRAMTTAEIAKRMAYRGEDEFRIMVEVDHYFVESIAQKPTWFDVELYTIRSFTRACGLDFTSHADINRKECYFRKRNGKPTFLYLTSDPQWKTYYLPLIAKWRESLTTVPNTLPKPIRRLLLGLK